MHTCLRLASVKLVVGSWLEPRRSRNRRRQRSALMADMSCCRAVAMVSFIEPSVVTVTPDQQQEYISLLSL